MILALSGKMGCGKSTVADMLCRKHKYYRKVSFAEPLKRECFRIFGDCTDKNAVIELTPYDLGFLGIIECESRKLTVREILQKRGEYARAQRPNHWVNLFNQSYGYHDDLIIDDLRYPNEAQYIRERGGLLVRIRPYEGWEPGPFADHHSETALDDWSEWDGVVKVRYGELESSAELLSVLLKKG